MDPTTMPAMAPALSTPATPACEARDYESKLTTMSRGSQPSHLAPSTPVTTA